MLVFSNKLESLIFPAFVIFILPLLSYGEESLQPSFLSQGDTLEVLQGQRVTMGCVVENKGDVKVMWKRPNGQVIFADRIALASDRRFSISSTADNNFSISIASVAVEDEGNYTCFINTDPDIMKQVTKIQVVIPPTIIQNSPERIEADLYQNVTLNCSATGRPKPIITWIKEGGLLPTGDAFFRGQTLTLTNLQRKHNGVYRCTACNGNEHTDSATIRLNIEYKAMLLMDSYTVVHTGRQHTARLPCGYDGNPPATVGWYKGDELAADKIRNRFVTTNRAENEDLSLLIIRNPTEEDLGNYTCVVNNSLGSASGTFFVTGLPKRPVVVSDTHGQYSEIYYISWTVVAYDQPLAYELQLRKANKSEAKPEIIEVAVDEKDKSDSKTKFLYSHLEVLKDLTPATPYEVKVRAKNYFGWGDFSEHFIFETRELSPDDSEMSELNAAPLVKMDLWAGLICLLTGLLSQLLLLHR